MLLLSVSHQVSELRDVTVSLELLTRGKSLRVFPMATQWYNNEWVSIYLQQILQLNCILEGGDKGPLHKVEGSHRSSRTSTGVPLSGCASCLGLGEGCSEGAGVVWGLGEGGSEGV